MSAARARVAIPVHESDFFDQVDLASVIARLDRATPVVTGSPGQAGRWQDRAKDAL